MNYHKNGFTLVELMLVMILLGILVFFASVNYISSMKKGRDFTRKADCNSLSKLAEMYYEDNGRYPVPTEFNLGNTGTVKLCHPDGCTTKVYSPKAPKDPNSTYSYQYCTDSQTNPSSFQIYAFLENSSDKNILTPNKLSYCTSKPCNPNTPCNYGISSQNITPN